MEIIFILLVFVFIGVIYLIFENKFLSVTKYCVSNKKIPEDFDKVRIACLTDLHNNVYGKDNIKLISKINQYNPDYIVISGDMITSRNENKSDIALNFLLELSRKYTILYAYGNHESRMEAMEDNTVFTNYIKILRDAGVIVLTNSYVELKRNKSKICIYGINLPLGYYSSDKNYRFDADYAEVLLGKPDKNRYNILLAHFPNYFSKYSEWGADLVFSGHIHGGIMILPLLGGVISPIYEFFPKYDFGKFNHKDSVMLLSRGLGTHTIPVRVFNRPELLCVELRKQS